MKDVKSCEKIKEERPCAEDINFVAVTLIKGWLGLEYFRCNIAWTAAFHEEGIISWGMNSESKICYLDLIVFALVFYLVNEDIVRFDISVNNLLLLKEIKGEKELSHNHPDFYFREFFAVLQA